MHQVGMVLTVAILATLAPAPQDDAEELRHAKYLLELKLKNAERAAKRLEEEILRWRKETPESKRAVLEDVGVMARLKSIRISMDYQDARLGEMLSYLKDLTGLTFRTDKGLGERFLEDTRITIKVSDLAVETVLKLALHMHGASFTASPTGEVILARPQDIEALAAPGGPAGTIIEYLLSPVDPPSDAERETLLKRLAALEDDDVQVRDDAHSELMRNGRAVRSLLAEGAWKPRSKEGEAQRRRLQDALDFAARLVEESSLDRDVAFLARLDHDRAHARLKRLLSKVRPFSTDGFPDPSPGLSAYLEGWWAWARDRVTWNAESHRYEPR